MIDPMMQGPMEEPMQDPMQAPMEEPMAEEGLMDELPDQMIQELSDGISDYLHGPARDTVSKGLSESADELDDTIAAMSYQTMTEVTKQIAEVSPEMVTIDILMPLATETIDYMIEIAQAVGAPIQDEQDLRERSLVKMIEIHLSNPEVAEDPEQQAIAQEYLAEMMQDGSFDEIDSFLAEKIRAEGGDPDQVRQQGQQMAQQMAQPKQDPLAQGVQQGLMDMGGMV